MGPVDHFWFEELQERSVGVVAFELAHVFYILEVLDDERAVRVAFPVDEGEHGMAVFPAIFPGQPAGRFGQEAHADEEQDCRDYLDTHGTRKAAVPLMNEQP